jgi:hypothetical protein
LLSSLLLAPLVPAVALGLAAGAAAGSPVLLVVSAAAGALVMVVLGDVRLVAAGLAAGCAVDSDASSAPVTKGAGVAGMNSVAVGSSAAATSVGSSISWLASPD